MRDLDNKIVLSQDIATQPNLCDRFTDEDLTEIGGRCREGYIRDLASREKWYQKNEAGMDLAMQISQTKSFPWPGCSNVIFPLVTIAALQFSARSYGNLIQGTDVVRYRNAGEDPTGTDLERAIRIGRHMSWQVLEEDKGWEEQHDRLFINLSIAGTSFIKSYYDAKQKHNVGELVLARDLVVNYNSKSIESAPRVTHMIPRFRNEIHERIIRGTWKDIRDQAWYSNSANIPPPQQQSAYAADQRRGTTAGQSDEDSPFMTCEQCINLDLDGDGYSEPYIVTFFEHSGEVVRIVARWESDDLVDRVKGKIASIQPTEYYTKYGFIPAPDGGFYDLGFGTLIGPLNESVNTLINQLLDSGTMNNSLGGFLGRGAKMRGGVYTMAPWEWKRVDSSGDDLRKSLVPLPTREPSGVLFNLLGLMIEYTDRVSGATDQMIGKNPGQNTPAETSRNMTEQGMQIYSTIFKRVWRSAKEEFKKNHKLNQLYLQTKQFFGTKNWVTREDYRTNPDNVVPTADPNITSQGMRVGQAQMLCERATMVPGYSLEETERNFLRALRIEGVDRFYPGPGKVPPLPDAKAAAQEQKNKLAEATIKLEYMKYETCLREDHAVNQAKIAMMNAQAVAVIKDLQGDEAAHKLEVFKAATQVLIEHGKQLNERIKTVAELRKQQNESASESGGDSSGGVGSVEAGQGDEGSVPAAGGEAPGGEE